MLPLSPGRDSVPWFPYPNQAPNLVSLFSRRMPFSPECCEFSSARLPIPIHRLSPRGSQDQSRPRSEFGAAPRALCLGYTTPCFCGETEPPERLPSISGIPTFSKCSGDLTEVKSCHCLSSPWLRTCLTLTVSSRTPALCRAVFQIFGADTLPRPGSARYP